MLAAHAELEQLLLSTAYSQIAQFLCRQPWGGGLKGIGSKSLAACISKNCEHTLRIAGLRSN